jgi:Uma2 family endonuclease
VTPEAVAPVSVEEFWHLAHRLPRAELVAGRVVELPPPGMRHGAVAARVAAVLDAHVMRRGLGLVMVETGFVLRRHPATVRAPDVAVVLQARVPDPLPAGFFPGPPDLAVEVLSPDDHPGEVAAKVRDYLEAGSRAVWVVDPETATVTVHTQAISLRYATDELLEGGELLPCLAIPIPDLVLVSR